jgi:hypothetical protein
MLPLYGIYLSMHTKSLLIILNKTAIPEASNLEDVPNFATYKE